MKVISTTTLVTAAVALLATGAFAQDAGGSRRGDRQPPRPPLVAVAACDGAQEGGPCEFVGRFGEDVTGTCKALPSDMLFCRPDAPPPDAGGAPGVPSDAPAS